MADQNKGFSDPLKYPALVHMSTDDLKRLLAQELDTPDDVEPDVAFMEAILEVIKEREGGTPEEVKVDVEAALQKFHKRLDEEFGSSRVQICCQFVAAHTAQFTKAKTHAKTGRLPYNIAAVIVVFLAICGTASAFGLNIFHAVAEWTAVTFHFVSPDSSNNQISPQEDPFKELRVAVGNITDAAVVPNWGPNGTAMEEAVDVVESVDGTRLYCMYVTNCGKFSIRIQIYNAIPEGYPVLYQKSGEDITEYEAGDLTHYIFSNNDRCGAVWMNGFVEIAIQGDLTTEQLKNMIDSIYKE